MLSMGWFVFNLARKLKKIEATMLNLALLIYAPVI